MTDTPPAALFTFFEAMPRQGPGSANVTTDLFNRLRGDLPVAPLVADMGCGNGAAGLSLARAGCRVTGVDVHPPFLEAFQAAARAENLDVETRCASMADSGLAPGSLDLVWSEGAAYTVGFDAALDAFAALLKPGGMAVLSECTWLEDDPPAPAREYWARSYPDMRTVAGNLAAASLRGWRFRLAERLDPAVWEAEFYGPMEALIAARDWADDPDLGPVVAESRTEIELFRKFNHSFGYVFYVFEKSD